MKWLMNILNFKRRKRKHRCTKYMIEPMSQKKESAMKEALEFLADEVRKHKASQVA